MPLLWRNATKTRSAGHTVRAREERNSLLMSLGALSRICYSLRSRQRWRKLIQDFGCAWWTIKARTHSAGLTDTQSGIDVSVLLPPHCATATILCCIRPNLDCVYGAVDDGTTSTNISTCSPLTYTRPAESSLSETSDIVSCPSRYLRVRRRSGTRLQDQTCVGSVHKSWGARSHTVVIHQADSQGGDSLRFGQVQDKAPCDDRVLRGYVLRVGRSETQMDEGGSGEEQKRSHSAITYGRTKTTSSVSAIRSRSEGWPNIS